METNFTLQNIGIKTLSYKLKLTVQKRGLRERMINITKDTECFKVSKIPQLNSPWSFYFVKFRCRLEILLSFSII